MQSCQACLLTSQVLYLGKELGHFLTTWIHLYKTLMKITFLFQLADTDTAQKMKFPIKDFFSKCGQIRSFLRIWSHLLKKSLMENFIFCAV